MPRGTLKKRRLRLVLKAIIFFKKTTGNGTLKQQNNEIACAIPLKCVKQAQKYKGRSHSRHGPLWPNRCTVPLSLLGRLLGRVPRVRSFLSKNNHK